MIASLGALVVAILTAIAIAGMADNGTVRAVAGAHSAFGVVALAVSLRSRRRLRASLAGIRNLAPVPVSGPLPDPPAEVVEMAESLRRLGFRQIGVTDTQLPDRLFRVWQFAEDSGEVWAEIGRTLRAFSVLLSETPGGRQVETPFPLGEPIDRPELLVVRGGPTLEASVMDHRSRLAAERRAEQQIGVAPADPDRPEGWRVRTLGDYLAWERRQRARTGGWRIETFLATRIEPAIKGWAISVAVDAVAIVLLTLR
jgi:hypothetical protein